MLIINSYFELYYYISTYQITSIKHAQIITLCQHIKLKNPVCNVISNYKQQKAPILVVITEHITC